MADPGFMVVRVVRWFLPQYGAGKPSCLSAYCFSSSESRADCREICLGPLRILIRGHDFRILR